MHIITDLEVKIAKRSSEFDDYGQTQSSDASEIINAHNFRH